MTFPLIPSSILTSWRQREYQRRGYTQDKKSGGSGENTKRSLSKGRFGKKSKDLSDGTDSSTTKVGHATESSGTQVDIELGGIEVTREVNVDSESRPRTEESSFFKDGSDGSTDGLQNAHIRQLKSFDTPWLEGEQGREQNSSNVSSGRRSPWGKDAMAGPAAAHVRKTSNADPASETGPTSAVRKFMKARRTSVSLQAQAQAQAERSRASEEHQVRWTDTDKRGNVKYLAPRKG